MKHRYSRGYSIMEILVVVAIIGILSLVTVPAFINFQRRNAVRAGLRAFTADLRSCRQHAISRNTYVRLQFVGTRDYRVMESRDFGKTWTALKLGVQSTQENTRTLPETIAFTGNTYDDSDSPADGLKDIDFRPDGTAGDFKATGLAAGTITMRTEWKDILNQVVVDMSTTGQIKTTESKS